MPTLLDNDAKKKLINGVNEVCDIVLKTYGAEGGVVMIDEPHMPKPTSDGFTVAMGIHSTDKVENMAVALVQEVLREVVKLAGDGSTTAAILTKNLVNRGFYKLLNGVSHVKLREEMEKAKRDVLGMIDFLSEPVAKENIYDIAHVASNGNEDIARLIQEAYNSIEKDGLLEVMESQLQESKLEIVEGMRVQKGWLTPHFATNKEKMTAELDRVHVLLFDGNISDTEKHLLPAIKIAQASKTALLIICDEIHNTVADSLIDNKLHGRFLSCVVKNPEYGEKRYQILQDLEAYTGAKIYNPNHNTELVLGLADRAYISSEECRIERDEKAEDLDAHIEMLREQDSEFANNRVSNLSSNVAVLLVGGKSPSEMVEKKARAEDAVLSVKCALEDGTNAGGASTMFYIAEKLKGTSKEVGYNLVLECIKQPYMVLLDNAAALKHSFWRGVTYPKPTEYGEVYNVRTKQLEHMNVNGIKDSTKVLKTTLEKSVAVSILLLSTKGTITT